MTVRVNKSSFNIREKLSELGRKFGLKGSELAAAETVQEAREIVSAGRKNMVINGDMRISQRYGTTATTITAQSYVIDRYRCEDNTTGSTTHQQVTDAPPGFHNSLKVTVTGADTSVDAGDFHYFRQIIEGNNINHLNWGSSNAKTVTLSFWVKSSVTGNHGGSLWNNAFNRSFPFIYTINSANSWEYKSITVPGCTDGTWESGINRGINIGFVQNVGSVYQGPPGQWNSAGDVGPTNHVNLTATNGATWYITGIQLEVGRNATEFEHRSYGEELALCQRYYQKKRIGYGRVAHFRTDTILVFAADLPVELRTSAGSITQDTGLNQWAYRDGVSPTISSIQSNNSSASETTLSVLYSISSGGDSDETVFYYGGGSILIDAEF